MKNSFNGQHFHPPTYRFNLGDSSFRRFEVKIFHESALYGSMSRTLADHFQTDLRNVFLFADGLKVKCLLFL